MIGLNGINQDIEIWPDKLDDFKVFSEYLPLMDNLGVIIYGTTESDPVLNMRNLSDFIKEQYQNILGA